jgi:exoribonuclease R
MKKITVALRNSRKTSGKALSEMNEVRVEVSKDGGKCATFVKDSPEVRFWKEAISEMAILANSVVAQYLSASGFAIYRTCSYEGEGESAIDVMQNIIKNGVAADYVYSSASHDLVGKEEYCHFTSPIRRATDVICHFILKAIFQGKPLPFTEEEVISMTASLNTIARQDKKIYFADRKFRTVQAIADLITKRGKCNLTCKVMGWSGRFLNLMFTRVDEFAIYITWTYKRNEFSGKEGDETTVELTEYTIPDNKFDQGIFPDLDRVFLD